MEYAIVHHHYNQFISLWQSWYAIGMPMACNCLQDEFILLFLLFWRLSVILGEQHENNVKTK